MMSSGAAWPTEQREFTVPLTIGVLSDTHVYARGSRRVPGEVLDLFRRFGVGLIVHLGDVNIAGVLDELAGIAPVLAVAGNNDDLELVAELPEQVAFSVGDVRFLAIHGHGGQSARRVATDHTPGHDLVLFGHSHEPLVEAAGESAIFNPGSPTDRRWHRHFGVGIITVTGEGFRPELILFDDPAHLANIKP